MAFDADAFLSDGRSPSDDPAVAAAFAAAVEWVLRETGEVDGFLDIGSLDCHAAIFYLGLGLGRVCGTDQAPWSPDEVRAWANTARWPDPDTVPRDQLWAYWSARRFVAVCVEHGLGVWFN